MADPLTVHLLGRASMVVAMALALMIAAVSTGRAAPAPESFADLAEELLPSVVNISTSQVAPNREFDAPELPQFPPGSPFEDFFRDFFDRRNQGEGAPRRRSTSLGSGFIIDPSGYVVTNYHVIEGADEIKVILSDDTNLNAELVGWDDKTDLAVLKVETSTPLPAVRWGDSEEMRVGDWVVAIGNPFGLGGTVTAGIISARARNINAGPYDDFIQTDASINRGNSGGPMFNMDGAVIGINTAIFSPSGGSVGIGFAIPSSLARSVVDQIVEFGRTRRGWLGVRIQTVTDEIAESLGLSDTRGALVAGVTPGGPAEEAGIEAGDVIVEFDGREVDEMRRLPRLVAETAVNKEVSVRLWRQGQSEQLVVVLGELEEAEEDGLLAAVPDSEVDESALEPLGLSLAPINTEVRNQYNLAADVEGVVITDVLAGSSAEEKGLRPGEVIVEVGQEKVSSPSDVARKIEEASEAGRRSVLLLVEREGDLRFVALSIAEG
ncbi:MAG: DegQ family serine endoprotease [Inquilinaceae bacterium]